MPNEAVPYYISRTDGARFPTDVPIVTAPDGGLLDLTFSPRFPRDEIVRRPPTMWRYREALPLPADVEPITLGEGFTPLVPVTFSGIDVLVKQEQLFPSGSYKDRGAAMLISHVRAIGVHAVVEDSSGNAGAAVAAYSARGGIECRIFTPADTSPGKLAQIRSYGAQLVLVPGSREATARAVLAAAGTEFYASHSYNPFFFHGTKTFAYEVWEQLGWEAPDAVVVPVGNGTLLLGVEIGFRELKEAGLIDREPQIFGVQAALCSPLLDAVAEGRMNPAGATGMGWTSAPPSAPPPSAPPSSTPPPRTLPPDAESPKTVAEGIAIATPIRADQIIAAVTRTGGRFIAVTEDEIHLAHRAVSRAGFCIEPTSAVVIAALPAVRAFLPASAHIVTLFSGHGLKAPGKLPTEADSSS